jgi:small subunit ribosomal protein S2
LASSLVRDMLQAGMHFGHHCSRWNPKMKPYIYGRQNSIHIIDIRETLRGLLRAQKFLSRMVTGGSDVLFVGTKRQAREAVREHAERCGMHYVTERWLGGTLTNFRTIRSRLKRLDELEELMGSPRWESDYSKKMQSTLARELRKIRRNLVGIRNMTRLPGALIVVDVSKEINAVREANALGIPTVCLIDTDGDTDFASIPIPGNDDSMRSISLVVTKLADAVEEGKRARPEPAAEPEGREAVAPVAAPRRRGRRGTATARPTTKPSTTSKAATAVEVAGATPPPPEPAAESGSASTSGGAEEEPAPAQKAPSPAQS